MDMLKKARVKAMAAVKEVQTIVQDHQQSNSQSSYQHSSYAQQGHYTANQFSSHPPSYPQQQMPGNYNHNVQYVPAISPGQFQHQVTPSTQYSQYTPNQHQLPQGFAPPQPPRPQYHGQSQSFPPPAAPLPQNSYVPTSTQSYPNAHSPLPQTTVYGPKPPPPQLPPRPQQPYSTPVAAAHQVVMTSSPSPDHIYAPRPTPYQPSAGQEMAAPVYSTANNTSPNFTPPIQSTINQSIYYSPPYLQTQSPPVQSTTHPSPYSPPQNPVHTYTPPLHGAAGQQPYLPPSFPQLHTPPVYTPVNHIANSSPNPVQPSAVPMQNPPNQLQWTSSNPPQSYSPHTQNTMNQSAYPSPISTQNYTPPAQSNTAYQPPPQLPHSISPDPLQSHTPPAQEYVQQSAYPAPLKLSQRTSDAQPDQSQALPSQIPLIKAPIVQPSSIQSPVSKYSPPSLPHSKPILTSHADSHSIPQNRADLYPSPDTEQPGLIPVELEAPYEPQTRHFTQANPSNPAQSRPRQTKCSGFNGVLTDVVPFYELKASVVKAHNIPINPGGVLAICEYCFLDVIAPHPWLASCFDRRLEDVRPDDKSLPQISFEKMIGCGLAFPAIRQVIVGQAIPRSSVQPFLEYAKLDAQLPPCSGAPSTGDYYGSHSIEEIALCRSCFECYIRGTRFEGHFSLMQMVQPQQEWVCDVGYDGYIQRILLADLSSNNFSHFASEAKKKLSMPACTGEGRPIALAGPNSSSCFRSVEDNRGVFCSNCFYDCVAGLSAEKTFGFEIELGGDAQRASLACDLAAGVSKYFMSLAVAAGRYDVWHGPIMAKSLLPLCPSIAGKDEADLMTANPPQVWYYFKEHPSIEVCPRCYGMNVCALQAEELFVPITRPLKAEVIRQCYLSPVKEFSYSMEPMDYENTTAWRGNFLRNAITYGRDAGGDFTVARQVASIIASLPPACGSELRKFKRGSDRKFLGHQASNPHDLNDATLMMCEECFAYSVKGTPMESFFNKDLTHLTWSDPEGHRCSTWSKQCKRRLRTACETGDFASYAQWHHKREDVYKRLWAVIEDLKPMNAELQNHTRRINQETQMTIQMGSIRLAQQINAQTNAAIMGIGGSVAEASATDTGYRYGNSTVGMGYLTSAGANAAQAHHNAANMPSVGFQLQWKNVPLEELTVEFKKKLALQEELRKQWAVLD